MKKALITGITGQDGSYLTELLLRKGYQVFGIQRRASYPNSARLDHIYDRPGYENFVTVYGDLADSSNLVNILSSVQPDEIYNLGAQSHVGASFEVPEYTANITGLGGLRLLEAIKHLKLPARYYQASSSEMFGASPPPQSETTPFKPQSPYGVSKVFAFHITRIYREGYGIFASNGILFNHESPRRGINFVTRKITMGLSRVKLGIQEKLKLGNLEARRDWGYSEDYVEGIWRILQHDRPDDFVIATGESHSVREFVEEVTKILDFDLVWEGNGIEEKGIDRKTGKVIVAVDSAYFRPTEVEFLKGDSSKAQNILGWKPKTTFKELAWLMTMADLQKAQQEQVLGKLVEVQRKPKIV